MRLSAEKKKKDKSATFVCVFELCVLWSIGARVASQSSIKILPCTKTKTSGIKKKKKKEEQSEKKKKEALRRNKQ